ESVHGKLFALFADCARRNALAPQLLPQRLFGWRHALPGDFLSGSILAGKCEDWHGFRLLVSLLIPESVAAQTCLAHRAQPPGAMRLQRSSLSPVSLRAPCSIRPRRGSS